MSHDRTSPGAAPGGPTVAQRLALALLCAYLVSPLLIQGMLDNWRERYFLAGVVATGAWLVLAHACVRRPLWLHLALLPFYLTVTADLFVLSQFHVRLTSGYVIVALANRGDLGDFLVTFARPLSVAAFGLPIFYGTCLYLIRGMRTERAPRTAWAMVFVLSGVYLWMFHRLTVWSTEPKATVLADVATHESSSPLGVLFQTAVALKIDADNTTITARRKSFRFDAHAASTHGEEIYVWVIGESSRPHDWSLFGYGRKTNPELERIPGILTLPRLITTAPETRIAVPSMLSLRPITDWEGIQSQKSVVAAFGEAGFKTYWLSTQDVDGWAGIVPQIAEEAGSVRYFSQSYDGALLTELRARLAATPKADDKLLFILHSKGNHFDYDRRYPPDFSRFRTPHPSRRDKLIDAYDNGVLYTDWFLACVIRTLAERGSAAVMLYSSDHGENLLDDERQFLGHIRGTRFDLPVAGFFWLSDLYRMEHPEAAGNLAAHAGAPLSLSNLPHSLLDAAGIDTPFADRTASVFSSSFEVRPRYYVVAGKLTAEPPVLH